MERLFLSIAEEYSNAACNVWLAVQAMLRDDGISSKGKKRTWHEASIWQHADMTRRINSIPYRLSGHADMYTVTQMRRFDICMT